MTHAPGDGTPEPLLPTMQGMPGLDRQLRDSLETLRDSSDDAEFRRLMDDVLAGRTSLREAARTDAFDRGLGPGLARFTEAWESASPAEREATLAAGREELARLHEDRPPDRPER